MAVTTTPGFAKTFVQKFIEDRQKSKAPVTPDDISNLKAQNVLTPETVAQLKNELPANAFAADAFTMLDSAPTPASERKAFDDLQNYLGDLAARAKSKGLTEIEKQAFKKHDFKLGQLNIPLPGTKHGAGYAGSVFQVSVEPLKSTDPAVANDPNRKAYTDQQNGKVTWVSTGGVINATAGFNAGIPTPHGSVTAGINGSGGLSYTVLAPYEAEVSAAVDLAKNMTVDLPFNAKNALKMKEGTEVRLTGQGTIAGNLGVGIGKQLYKNQDFFSLGASANAGVGLSKAGNLEVKIKRLEGNKVAVTIAKTGTTSATASLSASLGLSVSPTAIAKATGGELVKEGVIEGQALQQVLQNEVVGKGGGILEKQVSQKIAAWANVNMSAVHANSKIDSDQATYVFEMDDAKAQEAYVDLLHFDARAADALAEMKDGPVASAHVDEDIRSKYTGANINVGQLNVFALAADSSQGHLVHENAKGELTIIDRAAKNKSLSSLLGDKFGLGKRAINLEMVQLQKAGQPAESYVHVTQTVTSDSKTTVGDARRFLTMAEQLGAGTPESRRLLSPAGKADLEKLGKTDRTANFFFNDQGLKQIGAATPEQFDQAFVESIRLAEGVDLPSWMKTEDKNHSEIVSLLNGASGAEGGFHYPAGADPATRYRTLTNRDLNEDGAYFGELKKLKTLVKDLANPELTREQRAELFANSYARLDMSRTLGTLARLAGPKNVIVTDLQLKDSKGHNIVFASEGALADPRGAINMVRPDQA